jgi:hypothetical protein
MPALQNCLCLASQVKGLAASLSERAPFRLALPPLLPLSSGHDPRQCPPSPGSRRHRHLGCTRRCGHGSSCYGGAGPLPCLLCPTVLAMHPLVALRRQLPLPKLLLDQKLCEAHDVGGAGAHVRVLVPALGDELAQRLGAFGVHPGPLAVDCHLESSRQCGIRIVSRCPIGTGAFPKQESTR